jgi:hypothetical protein
MGLIKADWKDGLGLMVLSKEVKRFTIWVGEVLKIGSWELSWLGVTMLNGLASELNLGLMAEAFSFFLLAIFFLQKFTC